MFVVKVPGVNGSVDTKGCEKSGNEILKFLKERVYSNEIGNPLNTKMLDLEEIHLDNSNLKLTNDLIYKNSLEIYFSKPKVVFLGGDHSISYSLCKSFLEHVKEENKKPCLIIFDSRADCNSSDKKNLIFPTNRNWLKKLVEEGFPPENILLVGVRNQNNEEEEFLKKNKLNKISLNFLIENIEEICEVIMDFSSQKELYLSIDISVLDPVFAPGVECPEIGGLSSRQILYLIQRINKIKKLRAIDIVEINHLKDRDKLTIGIGAKILAELI